MNRPHLPFESLDAVELGRLLGERRTICAVGARCSAAHAQLLQRIRDKQLYLPSAPSWRAFCAAFLGISRRHADRLIFNLNRFGPMYFELSSLTGVSPEQYLEIEPLIHDDTIVIDGVALSVIPENSQKIRAALGQLLHKSKPAAPAAKTGPTVHTQAAELTSQAKNLAHRLVALYRASASPKDREFILECATEIRLILMQPDLD